MSELQFVQLFMHCEIVSYFGEVQTSTFYIVKFSITKRPARNAIHCYLYIENHKITNCTIMQSSRIFVPTCSGCFSRAWMLCNMRLGLCILDRKLASVLTHIEIIKFIRFVSTGTVSTSTRECHYY